jgi:cytochrome c oxidase subunit III
MTATSHAAYAPRDLRLRDDQLRLGLWMFLATVTMLFAAFTSAYIVRRSGTDWRHVDLPSILWVNTGILAASSVVLELANRHGLQRRWKAAAVGLGSAALLGLAFLVGQVVAWRDLVHAGVYLPSNPHSSFFFMLTGAHAVHLVAALAVLACGLAATRSARKDPVAWLVRMELCRTFWHYLGGVWLALFALVSLY